MSGRLGGAARWAASLAFAIGVSLGPGDRAPAAATAASSSPVSPSAVSPPVQESSAAPPTSIATSRPAGIAHPPGRFVRTIALFRGRLWLGTFTAGLCVVDGSADEVARDPSRLARARAVSAPFRMVNELLAVDGALYVAANEGLFVSLDGERFRRVEAVDARGVSGLASDGQALYATTTSALWRLRTARGGPPAAVWWRPAGSRSLQGVVAEGGSIWLASEDRGVIAFDGRRFVAHDRLAGLPSSWVVALAGDGSGGVFAGTLRDGAVHLDAAGGWEQLPGLPTPWTLTVVRREAQVCVGTQAGAVCLAAADPAAAADLARASGASRRWGPPRALGSLPDERVHALFPTGSGWLVGTEDGIALYAAR